MCKSQLDTHRSFLQGEWAKLQKTESCDLHQRLGGLCCTCRYQVYLYGHIMSPLKDVIVCERVGGWVHASEEASAITATKLMEKL